jgi:hypothetical protein
MTTFLAFLGILFLAMIAKFIYDTYLTNNTDRRWQALAAANPMEAQTIENNRFLNFNTDYSLRHDGIYTCFSTTQTDTGDTLKKTYCLVFGKSYVLFFEGDNHTHLNHQIKKDLVTLMHESENIPSYQLPYNLTSHSVYKNRIGFIFSWNLGEGDERTKFFDGILVNNGLVLSFRQGDYC